MQRISCAHRQPLFDISASRRIELEAASTRPAHSLMQSAGLSVSRLTLALAPHARTIWIACGPGNNGGDGFEAAARLHQRGKRVVVTWTGAGQTDSPTDAEAARAHALSVGVPFTDEPPENFDFCVDALLGLGEKLDATRAHSPRILSWLHTMRCSAKPCLAVDVPSGLSADTGAVQESIAIYSGATSDALARPGAKFTLSLLTLKPGLFTYEGRDTAGEVWFDNLGVTTPEAVPPSAWLLGADGVVLPKRWHAQHKGSFGDVAVLGGGSTSAHSMVGAALLAASAALHTGAGRVFVALLGGGAVTVSQYRPELMFCSPDALNLLTQVMVCGCGGGEAINAVLPKVLSTATRLVLDADALNAIAKDTSLQTLLKARAARNWVTVLTPHPLEAARLLQATTAHIQSDRLKAAAQLAQRYGAVIVLKGSGSVVAGPGQTSCINSSGNALLATAGTGDVLAGMLGAFIANGLSAFDAACSAVFAHGQAADHWAETHPGNALTASRLAASV